MGGLLKGCFWGFAWIVSIIYALAFPPLLFVMLIGTPFVLIWNYLKKRGW
jgi:hypothetical protein